MMELVHFKNSDDGKIQLRDQPEQIYTDVTMPILSLMVALHRRDSTIFKVFFLFYR